MRIILFILFIIAIITTVSYFISRISKEIEKGFNYAKLFGLAFMLYSFISIIGNSFY